MGLWINWGMVSFAFFFFFLLINWKIEEPDTLMGLIQQSGRVC